MSYCRFLDADVYVFASTTGAFECCGCWLGDHSFRTPSRTAMIAHLGEHRAAGHHVPDYVFAEFEAEIAAVGDLAEWEQR